MGDRDANAGASQRVIGPEAVSTPTTAQGLTVDAARRLAPWISRWGLQPDGEAFETLFGSVLMPVRHSGRAAMLKVAGSQEERDGAALMVWWAGEGAASILRHDGEALLMERAAGRETLAQRVRVGEDDEASRVLCAVARALHSPRNAPRLATLKPLDRWFRALRPASDKHGGILREAARVADSLLADPRDETVLHGDLHHDNVLPFGDRGWLAIDPKGLVGERGFDFANLFCNPWPEAADAERLTRRLTTVCATASLEPVRQLRWILAYAGLSAAWTLESGMPEDGPWRALRIAEIASARLG